MTVQIMADRVSALLADRLGVRGRTLSEQIDRAGRRLPRKVRAEARILANATGMSGNPKLAAIADHARVARAYDTCVAYLGGLGRKERRTALLREALERVALAIFVTFVLVVSVLWLRGFV
ncbi:MAG: hypothetical protein ACRCSU_08270 [Paracoccaceae bacterium]